MLANATLQTLICSSRMTEAEPFYSDTLGLPLVGRSHGALIYAISNGQLRVCPVPDWQPSSHTVVGFAVADLALEMRQLSERGIRWERVPQLPQDEADVLTTGDGAQVAWFRDPDGNWLSVVQFASADASAAPRGDFPSAGTSPPSRA